MERRKRYLLGADDTGKTLRTHGEGGTNPSQTREQVVATISRWNQPGRLRHNYTESKDSVRIRFDLTDGSRVSITKPVNPYTPETLLVTAFEPNGKREQLTAEYIYEKSEPLQHKYWQATLAQLIALRRQTPLEVASGKSFIDWLRHFSPKVRDAMSRRHIFFMENTGPLSYLDDKHRRDDLDGYSPRTSRTGADIHLHVAAVDSALLSPGRSHAPHEVAERQTLRGLIETGKADTFLEKLSVAMQKEIPDETTRKRMTDNMSFLVEEGIPVGYSLRFNDIHEGNALKYVDYFAQVLKAHFHAYRKTQTELFGDTTSEMPIPQPSFRTYGTFERGKRKKQRNLIITIAPQTHSFGGPLEAAGVELQRGPDVPKVGTDHQQELHRKRVIRTTRRLMKDRKHEVRRVDIFTEPEWP